RPGRCADDSPPGRRGDPARGRDVRRPERRRAQAVREGRVSHDARRAGRHPQYGRRAERADGARRRVDLTGTEQLVLSGPTVTLRPLSIADPAALAPAAPPSRPHHTYTRVPDGAAEAE